MATARHPMRSPLIPMSELTDTFLEHTRRFWQERTDRVLSIEDARQIATNVTSLFQLLAKWATSPDQQKATPGTGVRQ